MRPISTRVGRHFVLAQAVLVSLFLATPAFGQAAGILNSAHNLSASGQGTIRASSEQQICVFCHIPHNAAPVQPLWNRELPAAPYTVYSSSSLVAAPGQPTGASKLCLSCHDGTIAIGSVLSSHEPIATVGGVTTLPAGPTNLGTDLSDDHPISFRYSEALAVANRKLKPPSELPPAVKLDGQQELQCTSCHDAHDDRWGKFLVMDNSSSQLCNSCHHMGETTVASHVQCSSCHQPHNTPSGAELLKGATVTETCLPCHGGQAGANQGEDVAAELGKTSRHTERLGSNASSRDPTDVTCAACHEPHTIRDGTAAAPLISPKLGDVSGSNAAGATVPRAQYEYEVCFKCHASTAVTQPLIGRQIVQNDTRLEFAPSAASFHPVEAAGKNLDVPSLQPGLTTASLIYCSDCHASDTGSGGVKGVHGSDNRPLLSDAYETLDATPESATAYALCYRCHNRSSILANQSFSSHSKHIVDRSTPCSVCHDSHGIASAQGTELNNAHLVNFDASVVRPDPVTQRLEYRATGPRTGECFLICHDVPHSPRRYPLSDPSPAR